MYPRRANSSLCPRGHRQVLELRSEFVATVEQTRAVNCQLIVRSELLELPWLDLVARLREEADENPALELEIGPPLEEIPTAASAWGPACAPPAGDGALGPAVERAPAHYDLRDELHRRAGWVTSGRRREIAAFLIESIDERGYLGTTILDAARELGAAPAEVEAALCALQRVAPPGVGARDLRECLLLQLAAMDDPPAHARALVECCHEIMDGGGMPALQGRLGLTTDQLEEALAAIRGRLTPYPGEQFRPPWHTLLPDDHAATTPDVILHLDGEEIEVELVSSRALTVRVAEAYDRLDRHMRTMDLRADDDATMRARAQARAARQLIWSLQQRERSLHRICRAIARCQRDFILHGPRHHLPLTQARIAEITGLHESTVSRATAGKLVMLPVEAEAWGGRSVPFSIFFDDALPARTVLRSLVATEPPAAPLTDEQLQAMMRDEGFELARRTINKYRRALNIPSSGERRRIYQAA